MQTISTNWPDAPGTVAWLHSLGFQVIWYLSRGNDQRGSPGEPGSYHYEMTDGYWLGNVLGVDGVKLDQCPAGWISPEEAAENSINPTALVWNKALSPPHVPKPIFTIWTLLRIDPSMPGFCNVPQDGQGAIISTIGHSSTQACTNLVYSIANQANGRWNWLGSYPPTPWLYGPRHFKNGSVLGAVNDTNVLLAGFCLLTAMLNNPMLIDFVPTNNLEIWTNREIIAIMQDEACVPASYATNYGGVQLWVKPLGIPEKCRAVCLFNTNSYDSSVTVSA